MSVVKRYFLLIVVAMTLFAVCGNTQDVYAAPKPLGCCMPDNPTDCFDGSINDYAGATNSEAQATFDLLCKNAMTDQSTQHLATVTSQHILGRGVASICASYRRAGEKCEYGCCCKDAASPKTGERLTREACTILDGQDHTNDPRTFKSPVTGKTCDEVCGTGTVTPPTNSYVVGGTVVRKGTGTALKGIIVSLTYANNSANRATTGTEGKFTLPNPVPAGTQLFVAMATSATGESCRPGSKYVTITKAVSDVKIELDCSPTACTNPSPSVSEFGLDKGMASVSFKVNINDACGALTDYQVRRCLKTNGKIDPSTCKYYLPSKEQYFIDENVPENSELCYIVKAWYGRGNPPNTESSASCVITGTAECMNRAADAPSSWCGEVAGVPAELSCDEKNRIKSTICTSGQVCTQSGAIAKCGAAPDCYKCNGLLGFFSKLSLSIGFMGLQPQCSDLSTSAYPAASRCFKDNSQDGKATTVPVYKNCVKVKECGDYMSKDACETNTCETKKSDETKDSCTWKVINEELGKGICTSNAKPACSACDKAMGFCTKEICSAISAECYFDELRNGLDESIFTKFPRCIRKADMSCRYYDTQSDCLGNNAGRAAVFSPVTNELTMKSTDKLGLGVCSAWVQGETDEAGRCIKDADRSNSAEQEDDCIELGVFSSNLQGKPSSAECLKDMTPPTTTIVLRNPAAYGNHEITSLPFVASDDTSTSAEIKTLVCFDAKPVAAECRPNKGIGAVSVPTAGDYVMRYYSADKNGNLETVKKADITIVDAGFSTLEKIEIVQK